MRREEEEGKGGGERFYPPQLNGMSLCRYNDATEDER
jgi:hypothetical protein